MTVGPSNKQTDEGDYVLTLVNTISHANGIFYPQITFTIKITDPCKTTVLNPVSLTTLTVINGEIGTLVFAEATDSVEVSKDIDTICGLRSHSIIDHNNGDAVPNWVAITYNNDEPKTYTITATPTDEALHQGTKTFKLFTTLDDYYPAVHAGIKDTLTIVVTSTPCDCTGLLWTAPALQTQTYAVGGGQFSLTIPAATVDQVNSELLGPKMRACYAPSGPSCATTQTYVVTLSDGTALPSFLTQNVGMIDINPTVSGDVGPWSLKIASTPTYGSPLDYNSIDLTITCTVTSLVAPAAPNSGLDYTLYDSTLPIDLSSLVYTQVPPCDKPATKVATWDLTSVTDVFTQNALNGEQLDV